LFLAKVIVLKHSVIYIVTLGWCCGSMSVYCVSHILFRMSLAISMSSVLCESYTVQNEHGYSQCHSEQYTSHNTHDMLLQYQLSVTM